MQLAVGEIVEGKITGITSFGVFVDLGEGKTGMVHISEIAQTFVNEIRDFVKENDVVKMKVLNISEDGKISLSIKRAMEPKNIAQKQHGGPSRPDNYVWTPKRNENASFEEMMNKFKQTSEEIFSDLKRKNPDGRRSKRGAYSK